MMVKLVFNFATIDEAQEFLVKNGAKPAAQAAAPAAPVAEAAQSTAGDKATGAAAGAEPAAKRGRKPKTGPAAADSGVASAGSAAAAAPPAAGSAATLDDVRNALKAVSDKFGEAGWGKVTEIIEPFGVKMIKELKPEQYAEVVASANKVLA